MRLLGGARERRAGLLAATLTNMASPVSGSYSGWRNPPTREKMREIMLSVSGRDASGDTNALALTTNDQNVPKCTSESDPDMSLQ